MSINYTKDESMGLIARIVVMIIAMGSVVFLMWKLNTTGIDPAIFHLDSGAPTSFDINNVTKFEWQSKNKIFSYDRDSAGRWLPRENEKAVNDLLRFISQIQLGNVEQRGSPSLSVAIDVAQERWTGSWDGLSFVWTSGPNKGKGEILNDIKNAVFFKGAHIFEKIDVNLCKNRIDRIIIQKDGKDYQIDQIKRGWEITQPVSKVIDPIFIEKWLIGLCQVKVKTIVDLGYAQSDKKVGAVTFNFIDGQKVGFFQIEKNFFLTRTDKGEVGLVLEKLDSLLEELKKEIGSATNP